MKPINLNETNLATLKLHGIRSLLTERIQEATQGSLSYTHFLDLLLEDEIRYRKSSRITRLLKNAGFRNAASCEAVEASGSRNLDKKVLAELSTCQFIRDSQSLMITGPTGVGKSFLATALGNAACRHGYSTLFFRMNALMDKLVVHRAQGTYQAFLKKLASTELLIWDDFGIKPIPDTVTSDIYDILDERERSGQAALIITTQLPIENWSEVITDPVRCEAITDRIVSKSQIISLKGESYRKRLKKLDSN